MQWRVGQVTITPVVELETVGGTKFILPQATPEAIRAIPWLQPHFADEHGQLKMVIQVLVVETPNRRVVVDTGLGNNKKGRRIAAWNDRNAPFLHNLTTAGYPPESIDTVLCTHLHADHVGWNTRLEGGRWAPTFRKARYLLVKSEYEYWQRELGQSDQAAAFADSVKPLVDARRVELLGGHERIADEVRLLPVLGHSPSHVAVLISSAGHEAVLCGDALHHPCQMAHPDWSSAVDHDPAHAARSRRSLLARLAGTPTLLIGAHFAAGRVVHEGIAFRLEPA